MTAHAAGVTAVHLLAATSSNSNNPGGVTGWLLHFHGPTAYALVGFLAFAEAALLVGFFIPGETAVVVGGVLAGLGAVDLEVMMAVVVVSAIVGDSVGFEVGKWAGPWLLERRPLKGASAVRRTMGLLERYGGPAVFLGRFVAFARAFIPGLAGMSGLRYRIFLVYNAVGGLIWGVGYTLLGYVVGLSFERILGEVGVWSLVIVAAVVGVGVAVRVVLERRRRRRRVVQVVEVDDRGGTSGAADRTGSASPRTSVTDPPAHGPDRSVVDPEA
jgi:membrane-associated protein